MGRDFLVVTLPLLIHIIPVLFYAFAQALIYYACIGTAAMLCVSVPPGYQPVSLLLLFLASLWFLGRSQPPDAKPKLRRTRPSSYALRNKRWRRRRLPYHCVQRCRTRLASSIHRLSCAHHRWRRRNARTRYRQQKAETKAQVNKAKAQQKAKAAAAPFTQLDPNAIEAFCQNRGTQFLSLPRLLKDMEFSNNKPEAKELVQ